MRDMLKALAERMAERVLRAGGATVPRSMLPAVLAGGFALALLASTVVTGIVSCAAAGAGVA
uniref:Uncharacterized protein n=1 Tax=Muribaculaceae bacterium Z82 TaxID=2304548 RepID=A0A7C9NW24_9BACT